MRFAGLALHDAVPDAKTIWLFREQLVRAGAVQRLFARFDAALAERGSLAKGGGIPEDWTPTRSHRYRATTAAISIPSPSAMACSRRPIALSVAPSNSAPASDVTRPPSNAATTRRPSALPKSNSSGLHSVGIGDLRRDGSSHSRKTTLTTQPPPCTYPCEKCGLALAGVAMAGEALHDRQWRRALEGPQARPPGGSYSSSAICCAALRNSSGVGGGGLSGISPGL
jgi:hypothetical protein